MKTVFPKTGNALIIGITGAPGAGKSSLVDKLALHYLDWRRTDRNHLR
jgi:LAO/AO transport system kinase